MNTRNNMHFQMPSNGAPRSYGSVPAHAQFSAPRAPLAIQGGPMAQQGPPSTAAAPPGPPPHGWTGNYGGTARPLMQQQVREIAPDHLEGTSVDPPVQLGIALALEREEPIEQAEQEDARGPDVGRGAVVLGAGDYLGGHVGGCAAEHLELTLRLVARREAEVDYLDILVLIKKDIL